MATKSLTCLATAALVLFSGVSATLDPIVIEGNHFFFKSNGSQFYIKGVAYQTGINGGSVEGVEPTSYKDPLASDDCKRDIPYLQELGANTIRTYALDPTLNHDECMSALDDAGIYLITDLSEPSVSIDRTDPEWNTKLYSRYTSVIDAMAPYANALGFFAGNEVSNNLSNTDSAAYVKAAVRDTKAYIKEQNYRPMGVGYAADDDATVRAQMASFLNCGNVEESIDFWGYNIYEWCGDSSFTESGYDQRVKEFADYSVPVFFAEYGCNKGGAANRIFSEVDALYGEQMTEVISGGIVFEYFQAVNDYGLVTIDRDSVSTLDDYNSLSSRLAGVTPTSLNSASFTPTNTVLQNCPTVSSGYWNANSEKLPPTPNKDVCSCMVSSLRCKLNEDVSTEIVGELFAQVCGYNDGKPCASGINRDTGTGSYGAYSMCDATEQLSYAMNAYYTEQGNSDACDFGGNATLSSNTPSAASSCSGLISSATSAAGSGSGSASSSSTGKKSEAALVGPVLGTSKYWIGGYVSTLLLSVIGIFML